MKRDNLANQGLRPVALVGKNRAADRAKAVEGTDDSKEFERLLSQVSAKYISLAFDEIQSTAWNDFRDLARLSSPA
jgi:hypothetical protein